MAKKDDSYNLRKIFEQIELDLVASMKRNLSRHEKDEEKEGFKWEQWQSAKLRNLRAYRNQNEKIIDSHSDEIKKLVSSSLEDNYNNGQNIFKRIISKISSLFADKFNLSAPIQADAGQEDLDFEDKVEPKEDNFFHMNDKKLSALKESVSNDLDKAQHSVLRKMDDVYRKTVYNAHTHMAAGAKSLGQAIDLATKDFLNQGVNCIQYKNGRLVNIASYAEMALRTASHMKRQIRAFKQLILWVFGINQHNKVDDECTPDFSCCTKIRTKPIKRLWFALKFPFKHLRWEFTVMRENKKLTTK